LKHPFENKWALVFFYLSFILNFNNMINVSCHVKVGSWKNYHLVQFCWIIKYTTCQISNVKFCLRCFITSYNTLYTYLQLFVIYVYCYIRFILYKIIKRIIVLNNLCTHLALSTCGQTIRENGTYFVNSGYPEGLNNTGTCQVTIHKLSPHICQFRYV